MPGIVSTNPLSQHPHVIAMLHPTLNEGQDFSSLAATSPKKVWWQCGTHPDHAWLAPIKSVAINNVDCWVCSNKTVLTGFNDLAATHPQLVGEWDYVLNGALIPQEITSRWSKKVWWLCEKGHSWDMPVNDRANRGRGCPVCSGQKTVAGVNDLATTHPTVAAQWHPTRNSETTPNTVAPGSSVKYWWFNPACGHEWFMSVDKRTRKVKPQGCSVCAGKTIILSTSLATTHPAIAAEWHPTRNGKLTPEQVKAGTHKKYWWVGSCGHEWEAVVKSRTLGEHGCPYCAGKQVLVGFNDLATLNPTLATQWHPTRNLPVTPAVVIAGSKTKYWWQCGKGHEWEALADNRHRLNTGCPVCAGSIHTSAGETQLKVFIESLGFATLKTRKILGGKEIDIYVPKKQVGFEYNGLHWHTDQYEKPTTYHYDKWKACKKQGIQLIQIWEDDWVNKQNLLKRMIAHKLGVSTGARVFARKTRVVAVNSTDARMFLEENHLQGFRNATYFGLRNSNDELVALLGVVRKTGNRIEIARFATSMNVVGGFSKLLKHIMGQYPEAVSILSYSHNDHSTGGMYEATGFLKQYETRPGYAYYVQGKRVNRLQYTKKRYKNDPTLQYKPGLTEQQLAELNGLCRVWDCGSTLWEKTITRG